MIDNRGIPHIFYLAVVNSFARWRHCNEHPVWRQGHVFTMIFPSLSQYCLQYEILFMTNTYLLVVEIVYRLKFRVQHWKLSLKYTSVPVAIYLKIPKCVNRLNFVLLMLACHQSGDKIERRSVCAGVVPWSRRICTNTANHRLCDYVARHSCCVRSTTWALVTKSYQRIPWLRRWQDMWKIQKGSEIPSNA